MTDDDPRDEAPDALGRGLRKGLTRSRRQKVIGGVCGGLGRYFRMDPVIFRVVFTVLALTGGVGLIAYGIGWLLIPTQGEDETELHRLLSGRIEGTALTALLFALVGSGLFLSTMDNGDSQAFSICLVAALVGAVYWSTRRRATLARAGADGEAFAAASGQVSDAPPAAQPPPAQTPSWWRESRAYAAGATGYLWGPDDGDHGGYEKWSAPSAKGASRAPGERRERSGFGLGAFCLAALAATAGTALSWRHHPLGTIMEIGLVSALGVFGLCLVIGAFRGHPGRGTIFWATLSCVLLVGAASLPKSVGTDWHRENWRPATAAQVRPSYQLGAGQGTLDLTGLNLKGGTTATSLDIGAGQLRVRVPEDATVDVHANVGLGDIRFPDEPGPHNVDVHPGMNRSVTLGPLAGRTSSGKITLNLKVGVGEAVVLRGTES
ncbi:PspC domain-containing protein [Streptantibioticus ferralitis]|uniref:PspC domain-containing protein n=1 Tax=Streptantibioticus ferralitis TaxID=236510 RepID=A0ABT5Z2C0_9ACTN|nr:PspC domain-containing protein [Streptantibioticus ferralitis]MDF2257939.1 PspC domain-containing protein [Streptantibioticus ferralitis]